MEEFYRKLQERNLARLAKNEGFQFTDTFFPYTSGEIGPYYVQSAAVLKNGKDYANAIKDMGGFVIDKARPEETDVLSGGESRDWCFSFPIAAKWNFSHMMIYKNGKVIGPDVKGKNVIHVADLSNEGSSPRDLWVPAIRDRGGKIEHIVFYVDRMEEGPKVMKELGLQSHALVPLDQEAWDYLLKEGVVDADVYRNLRKRGTSKPERDAWAIEMLKSGAGMKELARLVKDPKTASKALKIVEVGYPEIKEVISKDLLEILGEK